MTNPDIFIRVTFSDKVKLKPNMLIRNKNGVLLDHLLAKYGDKCTYHGFILKDSISIVKYSSGQIKDVLLNGDVEYVVTYSARVCNPAIGSTVSATVVNQNMFGILAEVSANDSPVLEVIVAKGGPDTPSTTFDSIKIGDVINVEILKKKFELGDTKIMSVGKLVHYQKHELDGGVAGAADDDEFDQAADDASSVDDDEEDEDEDKEDKEEDESEEEEDDNAEEEEESDIFGSEIDDLDDGADVLEDGADDVESDVESTHE